MKIKHFSEVPPVEIKMEGVKNVKKRLLLGPMDGTPSFAMRMFEIEPDGYTPYHTHPYEHEVFVLEGEGELITAEGKFPLSKGDVILVPPSIGHQFKASKTERLVFLCVVPNHAA